jgi:hypothetical protein
MKTAITKTAGSNHPSTTIITIVKAPIDQAFHYIAPIYLPRIFPGAGPIAGISDTSINEGWNKAGLSRIIYFKDGTTSQETMLTFNAPTSFSYQNENFTSAILGSTMVRLEGDWLFTKVDNNTTKIEWTYRAIPKNFFSRLFFRYVMMRFMKRMLQQAMDISKNDLETGNLIGAQFPVNASLTLS